MMKPPHCGGFIIFIVADFRKLLVWQKAHALSLAVDEVAASVRGVQYSHLRTPLTRSSDSIPANIVEGRISDRDYASLTEQVIEVRKMLHGLVASLVPGSQKRNHDPPC